MASDPSLRQTKVDLSGLMKVLAEHLYSSPYVAIRELVQNAHDSCVRRRIESPTPFAARIDVYPDAQARTLSIEDPGAGLTEDEIERYLATIGAGYTRVMRARGHQELIGQFGLGFVSAFVISERIEVWTCSVHAPDQAWSFRSRSGHSYSIQDAPSRPVGTRVTLHLQSRFEELSRAPPVRALLDRYCGLLEVPLFCGEGPAINDVAPPWRDADDDPELSPLRARRRALAFAQRFESGFEPLCTLPIRGTADSDVRGLMWIQDGATYGTSDNRNVGVYVRGMLVSRDARALLPPWAGFVGALVESDALRPTASREGLQEDERFEAAQASIGESLVEGLRRLALDEPAAWRTVLRRHNEALLGAALSDPRLFDLLGDALTVPTSQGDLPVRTVRARSDGRIHVSQAERGGFEELLFRALKVPVVQGTRYGALSFCREYVERHGGRLVMVGTPSGDRELFRPAVLDAAHTRRLQRWFGGDEAEVVAARFEPRYLPFVVMTDRDAALKHRLESDEADRHIASAALSLARRFTRSVDHGAMLKIYVNLDCSIIPALLEAPAARTEPALAILRPLLGLLSASDEASRRFPIDESLEGLCAAVSQIVGGRG